MREIERFRPQIHMYYIDQEIDDPEVQIDLIDTGSGPKMYCSAPFHLNRAVTA